MPLPFAVLEKSLCRLVIAVSLISVACADADEPLSLQWTQLPSLPETPGVASPFVGVSHGVLLVAGGANFPDAPPWKNGTKVWHSDIYALDLNTSHPTEPPRWKIVGQLPRPCAYGVSVQLAHRIICVGGSDAASHHRHAFALEWTTAGLKTTTLPMLPEPIANASGAIDGTTVYLAGGTESPTAVAALPHVFSLDLSEPSPVWKELPSCPGPPRMLSVAAASNGFFFLFSGAALTAGPDGRPLRSYLKDAWRLDTTTRHWTRLADLPAAVVAAPSPAPVTAKQTIVILGGDDGSRVGFQPPERHPGFRENALLYDCQKDTWTIGPTLQVSRVTVPVATTPNGWIMASGEERPGVRSPEVWQFAVSP